MKFRSQLILGFASILAMLVIISSVVFSNINSMDETNYWVEHTHKVIGKANAMLAFMVDRETGMRGFAVSGDEEFLDPYKSGKIGFEEIMADLQITVSDNPPQVQRLKEIEALANQWDDEVASNFIQMRREIREGEYLTNKINDLIDRGLGKQQMDAFRAIIAQSSLSNNVKREILLDMINMETGLRGFLLNKREEFLEPYIAGKENIEQNFSRYDVNTDITTPAYNWINNYAEVLISWQREASKLTSLDILYAEFNKKQGKIFMDKLRADIDEFVAIEEELLVKRAAEQKATVLESRQLLIWGSISSLTIGFIVVGIILYVSNKRLGGEPALVARYMERISKGDLTVSFNDNKHYNGLFGNMKIMVETLRNIVSDVYISSNIVESNSKQIATTSGQVSNGANDQATSFEEVTASMEQMTANIKQNAESADETAKIADKAEADLEIGRQSLADTLTSMRDIASKVKVIGEIAQQTNILALNAAVEAARAGDAGHGFAVVAEEVRTLAIRSQESAVEINNLADKSIHVADQTNTIFNELIPNIQRSNELVKSINISSQEQSLGAEQINNAMQQLSVVTQQNAASAQELSASSHELTTQSDHLTKTINFFDLELSNKHSLNNHKSTYSNQKSKTVTHSNPSAAKETEFIDEFESELLAF